MCARSQAKTLAREKEPVKEGKGKPKEQRRRRGGIGAEGPRERRSKCSIGKGRLRRAE